MSYLTVTVNSDEGAVGGDFDYVVAPLYPKIQALGSASIRATAPQQTGNEFGVQTVGVIPAATDLVTLRLWVSPALVRPTGAGTSTTLLRIFNTFSGGSIAHQWDTTTNSGPTLYESSAFTVASLLGTKTPTEVFVTHAADMRIEVENTFTDPNHDLTGTVDVYHAEVSFGTPPDPTSVSVTGAGGMDAAGTQAQAMAAGTGPAAELHLNQWGLEAFMLDTDLNEHLG